MRILIIDDEARIRSSLEALLTDEGFSVDSCETGEEGVERFRGGDYDVVLLDVWLPGMDGLRVLEQLRSISPGAKVLMMSGQADIAMAVRATQSGAQNFFEKPLNPDHVLLALRNIADRLALERRIENLETLVEREDEMIGRSPAMVELREAVAKASPTDGRVLIFGENGTGKELVARAVHRQSRRSEKSFVSLNCAALPKDLVESELFGYEKGAFTGASRSKPGRFEAADGGTLFLDEVGDMAPETQAKLLRVLEECEAVRVGGETPYRFDVRIIAATNKDLKSEIAQGRFREDLYFRLDVIPLTVPPLRERGEDIALLAQYFLRRLCERTGKGMKQWGAGALDGFFAYPWPGNVRELRNFVERLIIMSEGVTIEAGEAARLLPASASMSSTPSEDASEDGLSLKERMRRHEKGILILGYRETGGNVSELARVLRIDRANLHRKLKSYGIK